MALANPEQIDTFDAATIAFEIRFERELTSHWRRLESEAGPQMISSPSAKERTLLDGFFRDVQEEIGRAVHEYFPQLLRVATTYRDRIGDQSQLACLAVPHASPLESGGWLNFRVAVIRSTESPAPLCAGLRSDGQLSLSPTTSRNRGGPSLQSRDAD